MVPGDRIAPRVHSLSAYRWQRDELLAKRRRSHLVGYPLGIAVSHTMAFLGLLLKRELPRNYTCFCQM